LGCSVCYRYIQGDDGNQSRRLVEPCFYCKDNSGKQPADETEHWRSTNELLEKKRPAPTEACPESRRVVIFVSSPATFIEGRTQGMGLDKAKKIVEEMGHLVAAGWAGDSLNQNLVKCSGHDWRNAWLGKLEGYIAATKREHGLPHLVTVRGGRMSNWERQVLENELDSPLRFNGYEGITLSHFSDFDSLREWLGQVVPASVAAERKIIIEQVRKDKEIQDLNRELDAMMEKANEDMADVQAQLVEAMCDFERADKLLVAERDAKRRISVEAGQHRKKAAKDMAMLWKQLGKRNELRNKADERARLLLEQLALQKAHFDEMESKSQQSLRAEEHLRRVAEEEANQLRQQAAEEKRRSDATAAEQEEQLREQERLPNDAGENARSSVAAAADAERRFVANVDALAASQFSQLLKELRTVVQQERQCLELRKERGATFSAAIASFTTQQREDKRSRREAEEGANQGGGTAVVEDAEHCSAAQKPTSLESMQHVGVDHVSESMFAPLVHVKSSIGIVETQAQFEKDVQFDREFDHTTRRLQRRRSFGGA